MFNMIRNYLLPLIALSMATFALFHLLRADEKLPKLDPPQAPSQAAATVKLAGTGIVEAQTENIAIGSAQSGILLEVYYGSDRVGARVTKEEPLFRVDDRALRAQLKLHRANLESAKAELSRLEQMPRKEDVPPLEAKVNVARAKLAEIEDRYLRVEQLKPEVVAREEVAQRRFLFEGAKHELEEQVQELARLKAGAWEPDKAVARAAVAAAEANAAMIETEIDRCLVRSPVDGAILQVNVHAGEYVSGASSKTLILIGDLDRRRVRVDIDEQEIPHYNSSLAAYAVMRGDVKKRFELKFIRIEPMVIPKKNLTGDGNERIDTRVLQVVYEIEPTDDPPFVGQQLDVYFDAQPQSK